MASNGEARPSAEALLELAKQERRGRLKVFLGASPRVGKTYAMLAAAQRLKGEGKEVVVGVIETHGRAETAQLLEGLEVLPRKPVSYRGHTLMEFDLDGALARLPKLIIVDELAHTNAPERRHPKRYQDVEELLDAGIDVWTALNIQHVKSFSDVISSITGVTVQKLVPDTVIEKADDVVVVKASSRNAVRFLGFRKLSAARRALLAVLLCGVSFGVLSAESAALLSFFAYNFFFIEPIHTFTVASPHELLALTIILVAAIVTGGLAGGIRERSDAAQRRIRQTQTLFDFSRKLSGTAGLDDVLRAVASQTAGAVRGQTLRLSNFVANLLGMTRLENGSLDLKRDWVDMGDIVHAAAARARKLWPDRPIVLKIEADAPSVHGDSTLLEQVVFNLLDNANKHAPARTAVEVGLSAATGAVNLTVTDEGPGIPEDELERVFDKFYRGVEGDGHRAGTGLGSFRWLRRRCRDGRKDKSRKPGWHGPRHAHSH